MMKFLAVLSLFAAITLSHGHQHKHVHQDGEGAMRTCGAQEKTFALMEENAEYKLKRELEHKRALRYAKRMREKNNHSFRKFKNIKDKEGKRNLMSSGDIDSEPVIRIPIVYHVLYENSDQNLGDAQLQSQVDVLNKDFRALNDEIVDGDVPKVWRNRVGDSKIEFYIQYTYRVSISSASTICLDQSLMKSDYNGGSSAVDPKTYLNIWICDISSEGLLGYAYQPCLLDTTSEWLDGLVLGVDNVGSRDDDDGTFYFGSYTYDLGRTATHEVGHWLNLDHIWGTEATPSCSDTDSVDDTPPAYEEHGGCPDNSTNTCTSTDPETGKDLRDMYENYMDYTNDDCMFLFTEEQVWRMRSVVSGDGCRREMYYNGVQLTGDQTLQPSSQRTTGGTLSCNDGCPIAEDYIDDGYCDCSQCEDETNWTCETCSSYGCPTECYDFTLCTSNGIRNMVSISSFIGLVVTIILFAN